MESAFITGVLVKLWDGKAVVWTKRGTAVLFPNENGAALKLGTFIACTLGVLSNPIVDKKMIYNYYVDSYKACLDNFGCSVDASGVHAMLRSHVNLIKWKKGSKGYVAVYEHPLLGNVSDRDMVIKNPQPNVDYYVTARLVPSGSSDLQWIVAEYNESLPVWKANQRIAESSSVPPDSDRDSFTSGSFSEEVARLMSTAQTSPEPMRDVDVLDKEWEALVRRAIADPGICEILQNTDSELYEEILAKLIEC